MEYDRFHRSCPIDNDEKKKEKKNIYTRIYFEKMKKKERKRRTRIPP